MVSNGVRKKVNKKDLTVINDSGGAAIRKLRKYKQRISNSKDGEPPAKTIRHLRRLLLDCKDDEEFRRALTDCIDQYVLTDLLVMYNGSVNKVDKCIFDVLYYLERTYGLDFGRIAPLVFGKKAKTYYQKLHRFGKAIHSRLSADQVLDFLDSRQLWYTLLKLDDSQACSSTDQIASEKVNCGSIYDVQYILRLFISLLDAGSEVSCRKFVECNGLSLAFGSTSLHNKTNRALAYVVLYRFSQRLSDLSAEEFPERPFFIYLLKVFRNSIENSNQHIPHVVSHFMARVCKLFLHPEHPVFQPILSFLVLKPTIDLENVPEFYKLVMSSSTVNHAVERQWMLNLVADSMIEPNDYNIFQKRYGIRFCLSLFASCLSDRKTRKYILFILSAALRHPSVARDLFYRHNLQCWITVTIQQPWLNRWEVCFLCQVFVKLMEHFETNFSKEEFNREGFTKELESKVCAILCKKVLEVLCQADDEGKALWFDKLNAFIKNKQHCDGEAEIR